MAHPQKSPSKSAPQETKSLFIEAREQIMEAHSLDLLFSRFASKTAKIIGNPVVFLCALVTVIVWAGCGPLFRYSDTWQLVINTGTTIITFLVVFLIQNTQNRDAKALHLKLDELIRSHIPAHNDMIDIEKLSDAELDELEKRYAAICQRQRTRQAGNGSGKDSSSTSVA
jgi:low affinity Fe/Cu permease